MDLIRRAIWQVQADGLAAAQRRRLTGARLASQAAAFSRSWLTISSDTGA